MKNSLSPDVIAAAAGMCWAVQPFDYLTLVSSPPSYPHIKNELSLPVCSENFEDTVARARVLIKGMEIYAEVIDSDDHVIDIHYARLHELIDGHFLGILTEDEEEEMKTLSQWRDEQKDGFYQETGMLR